MADNKTTELTAMECLRDMLDERGVEWRKWTKGQVETKWFVPSGMTEFDSHFCSASVSKNHQNGPLHYKGYVISPRAAIEASLGKADDASANVEAISELRDLACDIHAAEIIDHVHITHRGWTFDSQWLDSWHDRFDSIADKLERAMATTVRPKAKSHPYGYERDTGAYDCTRCECGCINDISARYCNDCGGEIEIDESAEKEYYDGYSKHTVFAKKHDDGSLEFCERRYVPEDTATLGSEINGDTSDGYHTFNELYHHRAILFSVIVRDHRELAWKARKHHDGTMYDGMFIVGIETPSGQATYHYDLEPYWEMFDCEEREYAPEWDGHTSDDAIARIAELGGETCEWLPVESCHAFAGPGWECSNCGHEVGEYEHDFYNCCPICCTKVVER